MRLPPAFLRWEPVVVNSTLRLKLGWPPGVFSDIQFFTIGWTPFLPFVSCCANQARLFIAIIPPSVAPLPPHGLASVGISLPQL